MIKPEIIQEIFEASNVEEVVGDFVQLKRRGVNMIGHCPFHNEKTPSFIVSPSKGIYKCFGCGKGGNSVNFIMEHEHYSYPEALKYLANKYNIDVEEEELSQEERESLSERESLFHVSELANKFFVNQLHFSEEGKAVARSYFRERGFSDQTISKFLLGYSPNEWEAFTSHAIKEGYNLEHLRKAGLTIVKEDGRMYDRFRSRVIFPIQNLTGKVIGFGGRVIGSAQSKVKYVNSPESDIYNKSKVLYGIYQARNSIVREDNCLLVEGYTDVISLAQAGVENVVSSSGTSLTVDQIKLIKRFTSNITILFDGDAAGIRASFRGIDMILEQGMNVRVILFPDGEDPDSFARKSASHELKEYISSKAQNFLTFKTGLLLEDAGNDPVKRAEITKDIVRSIAIIPDVIIRTEFIKHCSDLMNVPERTLINEVNLLVRRHLKEEKKKGSKQDSIIKEDPTELQEEQQNERTYNIDRGELYHQEKEVIRLLLNYGHEDCEFPIENEVGEEEIQLFRVSDFIIGDLSADDIYFSDDNFQLLYDEYCRLVDEGKNPTPKVFTIHERKIIRLTAIDLMTVKDELSENWNKRLGITVKMEQNNLASTVVMALLGLKQKRVRLMIRELEEKLKDEKDFDVIMGIQKQHIELKEILDFINNKLNRPFSV